MPARKPIPFEGVLNCWNDEHDLPDLLLAVSRSGKTGRLLFSNPEANKTLYVKGGKFIFAESSSDDDGLGPYLLRNGDISLQDYTRVSNQVGPGKRLGALLVAEGVLGPKELVPAVVGQVRSIIMGLFRRTETWYGFKEEELTRKESITLDLPVGQLLLDGVQYIESWRRILKGVGDLESVYQLVESSKKEWSGLELEDAVKEMLSMLNQPVSVADLCTEARMPDLDACRYIWMFRTLGWIDSAGVARREPVTQPVMARPNPSSTVLDVSVPPGVAPPATTPPSPAPMHSKGPIPQHLVQTRVATAAATAKSSSPPRTAPVRRAPEELAQTQMAVDAPPPSGAKPTAPAPDPSQSQVKTIPTVTPPKSVNEELLHTQMYVEPAPSNEQDSPAPSTGEMMEAILDEGDTRHHDHDAGPAQTSTSSTNASTQFFDGANAFQPPSPSSPLPSSDASYDEFFPSDLRSGFDAPPLDSGAESANAAPVTVPSITPPGNGIEASEAAVVEPNDAIPVVEGDVVTSEPNPPIPATAGMELFAMTDPFGSSPPAVNPSPPTGTDDPLQPSVAASLPKRRRRTEELDLDAEGLGHVLGGDESH